jgi:hypothetical protein
MTPHRSHQNLHQDTLSSRDLSALSASSPAHANSVSSGWAPRGASADFVPDLELRLRATPAEAAILPGKATQAWTDRALRTAVTASGYVSTRSIWPARSQLWRLE